MSSADLDSDFRSQYEIMLGLTVGRETFTPEIDDNTTPPPPMNDESPAVTLDRSVCSEIHKTRQLQQKIDYHRGLYTGMAALVIVWGITILAVLMAVIFWTKNQLNAAQLVVIVGCLIIMLLVLTLVFVTVTNNCRIKSMQMLYLRSRHMTVREESSG